MKAKYFRYVFPVYIYVIGSVTMLFSLGAIVFNILKLFEIKGLAPFNPLIDSLSLLLAAIIIALSIISLIKSGFYFKNASCVFKLSVFSIKILNDNLLLLRHDVKSNLMLLYYNQPTAEKEENIKYIIVKIKPQLIDSFIDAVKTSNRRAIYELFDKDKE
ncbi:MAG: hypothetical protein ACOX3U_03080 [Christensenellales bacterium]|jgi:hypothetical protein